MIDLQLPKPLLDPTLWPKGDAIFSIYHLRYGGPFASRRAYAFMVPSHFWLHMQEPSLIAVIEEAFKSGGVEIISRMALDKSEQSEWRKVGATSFSVNSSLEIPTLLEWSREVFPQAYLEAGELHWIKELRDYESQLGPEAPSLDQLRFWPAFLRSRKMFFNETAAREWAWAQVLFSPQDDSRGFGASALLNPTMQITTEDRRMRAVWRVDGTITSREVTWEQAAVLDELRETSRTPVARLLRELGARRFPLEASAPFSEVIEQMTRDGLILLRE